jgi:hypothetical protein
MATSRRARSGSNWTSGRSANSQPKAAGACASARRASSRAGIIRSRGTASVARASVGISTPSTRGRRAADLAAARRALKRYGANVWTVGIDTAKDSIYSKLKVETPGPGSDQLSAGIFQPADQRGSLHALRARSSRAPTQGKAGMLTILGSSGLRNIFRHTYGLVRMNHDAGTIFGVDMIAKYHRHCVRRDVGHRSLWGADNCV